MQTMDLAIKYKNLHQAVELMIANIKEIGFDVSEYEKVLKSITSNVNNNVKVSYNKGFARANYEIDYSNGIAELNKLISHLEKYDVYFKVLNSCEWLNIRIIEKDITKDQLKQYVSEMIYNLKQIVKSDTMDYDNEKHIVEMVYEVAYKIIKLELMMTGSSSLYNYIKQEDINISYFNVIIKKELAGLKTKGKDTTYLKQKLFEIRKNGINSNYFDLDLIKVLLIYDGNNSFKDNINESMNAIINRINANIREIKKLVREYQDDESERKEYKSDIKENRKNIRNRLIAFLIATSIMIGSGIGVQKLVKKESIKDKYKRTIEIYSTITDEVTTETDEIYLSDQPEGKTIVRVYEPYKKESRRDYQYYDVSYLDFDSLKECYEYGTDNYGVVPQDGTLRTSDKDIISDYQNSYTEVIRSTYEFVNRELDRSDYDEGLVLGYFMYVVVMLLFEVIYYNLTDPYYDTVIIGGIHELYDETKALLANKDRYKEYKDKITKNINKILQLINQNEVLRNEFNRLYEANKYLLDKPDELYQRFSSLTDDEAKKLIKKYKDRR